MIQKKLQLPVTNWIQSVFQSLTSTSTALRSWITSLRTFLISEMSILERRQNVRASIHTCYRQTGCSLSPDVLFLRLMCADLLLASLLQRSDTAHRRSTGSPSRVLQVDHLKCRPFRFNIASDRSATLCTTSFLWEILNFGIAVSLFPEILNFNQPSTDQWQTTLHIRHMIPALCRILHFPLRNNSSIKIRNSRRPSPLRKDCLC